MKESYNEILAKYVGPESYADGGNTVGVVTAGVHLGLGIELRKHAFPECRHRRASGRHTAQVATGKTCMGSAESKTQSMGGNFKHENRGDPRSLSEKVADSGPKTPPEVKRDYAYGKSDGPVVPMSPTNNDGTEPSTSRPREGGQQGGTPGSLTSTERRVGTVEGQRSARCA